MKAFKASNLHPATWWLLGLCIATVASLGNSHLVELGCIAASVAVILLCREDAPWSRSVRFYVGLGIFVLVVRVAFRVLFNSSNPSDATALHLPAFDLGGIRLLGNVSWHSLEISSLDGLRLAAIIIAIGMANSLANPKRLLKSTPGALYEIATAMTVAINLAPQLVESLQRVRRARALRGRSKGVKTLAGLVIPVLEDTLDQSLSLAASMDARGFGRRGKLTRSQLLASRALALGGLTFLVIASYLLLATADQTATAVGILCLGLLSIAWNIHLASKRNLRTRFRRMPLGGKDYLVGALGLAAVATTLIAGI
ncbi:MAG: hypothetical protein RLZ71_865 [Actinomycetota bacterium]